jgi:tetratricopeptide (TPR) repeat protein
VQLRVRSFEAQLLVVLRERELAIDDAGATAAAEQLATQLPTSANAGRYLRILAAIRPDSEGAGERERYLAAQPTDEFVLSEIDWLTQERSATPLNEYLAAALTCELQSPPLPDANAPAVPLLTYRRALCKGAVNVSAIEQLRTDRAGFPEAAFFAARALMSANASSEDNKTLPSLMAAYAHFPDSPAITYQLATAARLAGNCESAQTHYAETLTLRPHHEDARLGRAMCFSHLGRHEEAIADTTALIEASAPNAGEALYWRARSYYQSKALLPARTDIDAAKKTSPTATTLMLAGLIEHDQADYGRAHEDIRAATLLSPTYCQAKWQLGVIDSMRQDFMASADAFAAAASCYADEIANGDTSLSVLMARTDVDPEFRARRASALKADMRADEQARNSAVLNAALNFGRAGERERANAYLQTVSSDVAREAIDEVRRALSIDR